MKQESLNVKNVLLVLIANSTAQLLPLLASTGCFASKLQFIPKLARSALSLTHRKQPVLRALKENTVGPK